MSWIKADSKKEQKHFNFLEKLRKSGACNMWGSSEYLKQAYRRDFTKEIKASDVVGRWMKYHSDPTRVLTEEEYRKL